MYRALLKKVAIVSVLVGFLFSPSFVIIGSESLQNIGTVSVSHVGSVINVAENVVSPTVVRAQENDGFENKLACGWGNLTGCAVSLYYYVIVKPTHYLVGVVAGIFDFFLQMSISGPVYGDSQFIEIGWTLARNFANIFFVFGLLVIAIKTILGQGSADLKRKIVVIVIAAIFINFSLFFTRVIIDASNLLARAFYVKVETQSTTTGELSYKQISTALVSKVNPQTFLTGRIKAEAGEANGEIFLTLFLMFWVYLFMVVVFLAFSILITTRIIMLWLLMIASPVAFALGVTPVNLETFGIGGISMPAWSSEVTKQSLLAPVIVFFLWLIAQFLEIKEFLPTLTEDEDFVTNLINMTLPLFIMVLLLMQGLKAAKKLSGAAGEFANKAVTKGLGVTVGVAAGGVALAGRGAASVANSKFVTNKVLGGRSLRDRARSSAKSKEKGWRGSLERWSGRRAMQLDKAVQTGSWDARNTKAAGWLQSGVKQVTGHSPILGTGIGYLTAESGIGGVDAKRKERDKKEAELKKELETGEQDTVEVSNLDQVNENIDNTRENEEKKREEIKKLEDKTLDDMTLAERKDYEEYLKVKRIEEEEKQAENRLKERHLENTEELLRYQVWADGILNKINNPDTSGSDRKLLERELGNLMQEREVAENNFVQTQAEMDRISINKEREEKIENQINIQIDIDENRKAIAKVEDDISTKENEISTTVDVDQKNILQAELDNLVAKKDNLLKEGQEISAKRGVMSQTEIDTVRRATDEKIRHDELKEGAEKIEKQYGIADKTAEYDKALSAHSGALKQKEDIVGTFEEINGELVHSKGSVGVQRFTSTIATEKEAVEVASKAMSEARQKKTDVDRLISNDVEVKKAKADITEANKDKGRAQKKLDDAEKLVPNEVKNTTIEAELAKPGSAVAKTHGADITQAKAEVTVAKDEFDNWETKIETKADTELTQEEKDYKVVAEELTNKSAEVGSDIDNVIRTKQQEINNFKQQLSSGDPGVDISELNIKVTDEERKLEELKAKKDELLEVQNKVAEQKAKVNDAKKAKLEEGRKKVTDLMEEAKNTFVEDKKTQAQAEMNMAEQAIKSSEEVIKTKEKALDYDQITEEYAKARTAELEAKKRKKLLDTQVGIDNGRIIRSWATSRNYNPIRLVTEMNIASKERIENLAQGKETYKSPYDKPKS